MANLTLKFFNFYILGLDPWGAASNMVKSKDLKNYTNYVKTDLPCLCESVFPI